ncbi:unnamed protein product [Diplocarpon coronariae]
MACDDFERLFDNGDVLMTRDLDCGWASTAVVPEGPVERRYPESNYNLYNWVWPGASYLQQLWDRASYTFFSLLVQGSALLGIWGLSRRWRVQWWDIDLNMVYGQHRVWRAEEEA